MNTLITLFTYFRYKYFFNFKNREQLIRYQHKRFATQLKKIKKSSPFYAQFFSGEETVTQCSKTINKQIMMANFDTLNTVQISKQQAFSIALQAESDRNFTTAIKSYTVGLSSGTSGNRGLFLVSPKEEAMWAGIMLAKCLPAPIWKRASIALFLRANSKLYEKTDSGRINFTYFDLLIPIADNLSKLAKIQPTIIVAPPSILRQIAGAIKNKQLKIKVEKIISVAEVLDPLDKDYLESIFGQIIHQIYQATEGFIGHSCAHGSIHLNEDVLLIEKERVAGTTDKFIPIISDLYRQTQPIIRYRLNDILTEKKVPCPCGSPFLAIEQIEGRCDDIFYLKSKHNQQSVAILPDFLRRAIICASDHINEYKIQQVTTDTLELSINVNVQLVNEKAVYDRILSNLQQLWLRLNCCPPIIKQTTYQANSGLKKLRRVECCVDFTDKNSLLSTHCN